MTQRLTDYDVLTFDCYGTLIDWESGIWDALQPLLMTNGRTDITREIGLRAFAKHETAHEAATPELIYPELLQRVTNRLRKSSLSNLIPSSMKRLGLCPLWPAFPDTADALILKRHFKLVILSNVNRDGFAASNRKLGWSSTPSIPHRTWAPTSAPGNFEYMLEHLKEDLGLDQDSVLHTAQSLHHDHLQAKNFGLANRGSTANVCPRAVTGATAETATRPDFDFLYFSMMEMAEAVESES